ncbi:P26 [Parapoynx stagnalis nucleopolyhedrovirus]|uniref:P26 n=1 Tax=Parapoynx stagnalis nucleopolyhedrovirus TaxID=2993413 RepID=A0A9E7YDD9_9ABAC|nr:P26 [Parapoynx stagnalis nucleopolyhedrovirus]
MEFEKYNVLYKIDHNKKFVKLLKINNEVAFMRIFNPGQEIYDEDLNVYHQFPGVAVSTIFPRLEINTIVDVLLNDNTLFSCKADKISLNYHICNNRLILGVLITVHLNNKDVIDKLYLGAPIFKNNKLISVVTALHYIKEDEILMPITGIRNELQISADLKVTNGLPVEKLLPNMSVYGNKQLPYKEIKQFIIQQNKIPENVKENYKLFYNDSEVRLTFNRGNIQIQHWRMPGPLIQQINKNY